MSELQFMDLIKNLLESQTVHCQAVLTYLKQFSKLRQENYVPHARRCISQLQTSAIQPSLAKRLAEIRNKVVPSLSWFGVVKKMAYGQGKTDMRAIRCRQLCAAMTTILALNKGTFVKSASPDYETLCSWVRTVHRYTRY